MPKISINLLPTEYTHQELKRIKFYKVQTISVVAILLVVFVASLVVTLRIIQSQNINKAKGLLSVEEQRVVTLKDRQASLFIIKNRLNLINQYLNVSSKQTQTFDLFSKILPSQIFLNSFSIDQLGQVSLSAVIPDVFSLGSLITNLTSSEKNDNKINQVSIENLNRSSDGFYRTTMDVKPN